MNEYLVTERLVLSLITFEDLQNIHELHSLPEVDKFNTLGIPKDIDETATIVKNWISKNNSGSQMNFVFKVQLKINRNFIGLVALNLGKPEYKSGEVWYKFHSDFWNKGYATEALNKVLDFGFRTLDLHRIEAGCAVNNIGSIRTLEKAGMIREGRKRQVLPLKNGWSDNFEYAILSTDKEFFPN